MKRQMDAMPAVPNGTPGANPGDSLPRRGKGHHRFRCLSLAGNRTTIEDFAIDLCGALSDVLARLNPVDPTVL